MKKIGRGESEGFFGALQDCFYSAYKRFVRLFSSDEVIEPVNEMVEDVAPLFLIDENGEVAYFDGDAKYEKFRKRQGNYMDDIKWTKFVETYEKEESMVQRHH